MKAEELRTLDGEELTSRLKGARRELYELRFKLAVGQLDDHRQIRKVRKDIAKILTVVHARRLGEEIMEAPVEAAEPETAAAVAATAETADTEAEKEEAPAADEAAEATSEETPENVETVAEAPAPAPSPRRTSRRKPAGDEGND